MSRTARKGKCFSRMHDRKASPRLLLPISTLRLTHRAIKGQKATSSTIPLDRAPCTTLVWGRPEGQEWDEKWDEKKAARTRAALSGSIAQERIRRIP